MEAFGCEAGASFFCHIFVVHRSANYISRFYSTLTTIFPKFPRCPARECAAEISSNGYTPALTGDIFPEEISSIMPEICALSGVLL